MWIALYALLKIFTVNFGGESSVAEEPAKAPEAPTDPEISDAYLDDLWYQYWLRTWF